MINKAIQVNLNIRPFDHANACQDIGMGAYQWKLFCLCGFGWLADNMWLQVCECSGVMVYSNTD